MIKNSNQWNKCFLCTDEVSWTVILQTIMENELFLKIFPQNLEPCTGSKSLKTLGLSLDRKKPQFVDLLQCCCKDLTFRLVFMWKSLEHRSNYRVPKVFAKLLSWDLGLQFTWNSNNSKEIPAFSRCLLTNSVLLFRARFSLTTNNWKMISCVFLTMSTHIYWK